MTQAAHSVREQVVELQVGSEAVARAVHAEILRDFRERVAPALGEAFDLHCPEGVTLRVERLEVELGALPREGFLAELTTRVRAKVLDALQSLSKAEPGAGTETSVQWLSAEDVDLERLSRFLALGVVAFAEPQRGQHEAWLLRTLERAPDIFWRAVVALPPEVVARRLAEQFGEVGRRALVDELAARVGFDLQRHFVDVRELRRSLRASPSTALARSLRSLLAGSDALFETQLHERAIRTLLRGEPRARQAWTAALFAAFDEAAPSVAEARGSLAELAETECAALQPGRPLRLVVESWLAAGAGTEVGASAKREPTPAAGAPQREEAVEAGPTRVPEARRELEPERGNSTGASRVSDSGSPSTPHAFVAERGATVEARRAGGMAELPAASVADTAGRLVAESARHFAGAPQNERPRADTASLAGQSLWVAQAGLVIVWPFLARFFETLGLVRERRFVDEAARERAVLLSAHLADERCAWGEHELLLPKILCGCAWAEPVPTSFELRREEVDETRELLTTLIGHWSALGSTSVAGLRQAFVGRPGQLKLQESGFFLEVSRAGHDVLLDRLPWGIGLVLLPWMQRPLHVEW
jgi:hypothetical protein